MEYHPIYYKECRHLSANCLSCDMCNARNTCITCYTSGFTNDQKDLIMSIDDFRTAPEEELNVPLQKVMEDMNNPDGGIVSLAAKDYYDENYSLYEEKDSKSEKYNIFQMIFKIAILEVIFIILFGYILSKVL